MADEDFPQLNELDFHQAGANTPAKRQAMINAHAQLIAEQQVEAEKGGYWPQAKELLRSTGAGAASLGDFVASPGRLIGNLGLLASGQDAAPTDQLRQAYDANLPPDPHFPLTTKLGGNIAPAVVEAFAPEAGPALGPRAAAQAARPMISNPVVRSTVAATTPIVGQNVGQEVGQKYGGDEGAKWGGAFGSILAPLAVSPVVSVAQRGARVPLTDPQTPTRVAQADTAEVPLSMGLVGSKFAGTLEDASAGVPFAGNPATTKRREQFEAIDRGFTAAPAIVRPGAPTGPINLSNIGGDVRTTAQMARDNAKTAQNNVLDPLYERVGRDLPIDQTSQLTELDRIRRGSEPVDRAPVDYEIHRVNTSRFDPENPPKIVDPGLEGQLQKQLADTQRQLAEARPGSALESNLNQILDRTQQQIAANRGQTFQEAINTRSKTGRKIEGQQPLDQTQTLDIKSAQTDAIAKAAELAGVPRSEFDTANAEYGRLAGQRDVFKTLAGQKRKAAAGAISDVDTLTALQEHAPSGLAKVMADALELNTRGRSAGQPLPDPEAVSPRRIVNWWGSLPDEAKELHAGPVGSRSRDQVEALVATAANDMRRPTRTLPGGGTSIGAPANMYGAPVVSGALGHLAGGDALSGAAGAAFPSVAAYLTGKAFTNENFVRSMANPRPILPTGDLGMLLAGAVQAQQQQRR